jgi:diguanylate cyclase (GGDEF)-like protein
MELPMSFLSRFFFGRVEFPEGEEFREFQFKFLVALLMFGGVITGLFLWLVESGLSPALPVEHMRSMRMFTVTCLILWLALRGRKHWFLPIGWLFEIASLLELFSAAIYVPNDELRSIWLFTNIPGVYLLLGRVVGGIITTLIIVAFVAINPYVASPYSPNAIATGVLAMIYFAVFFHAYARQSIWFFVRMRDSNRKLLELATRDTLTGVFNARAYYEICDSMIKVAQRNRSPYAVLFVDLDHFKSINDTYGHAAGDVVLKSVADCLTRSLRASDALGRIGGEEFSIYLPNTDMAGATHLAEDIRLAIESLMPSIGERRLKVTASIGVARNQHSDQTMKEIQQQADQAMYHAKAGGRNRVSSFDGLDALPA